jgi:hypothetical protein
MDHARVQDEPPDALSNPAPDAASPGPRETPAATPSTAPVRGVEREPWFEHLSEARKEEFRAAWGARRGRSDDRRRFARASLKRTVFTAAGLFATLELLLSLLHPPRALLSVPSGALAGLLLGLLWSRTRPSRFVCMVTATVPYVALRLVFVEYVGDLVLALFGYVLLLSLAGLLGATQERRATDGEDY